MDYQTLLNDTMNWIFSDVTRSMWIVGAIAVIGALNGIRCSLNHCKGRYNGRIL